METTVSEIQKQESARPDIQVVTSDNFKKFVDDKLADPEEAAKKELKEIEDKQSEETKKKAAEEDPASEFIEDEDAKKPRKDKLNERFRELTDGRKAAEKRAADNEAARKAAEDKLAAKEREIEELRNKYDPPKKDPDPKPTRAQFASDDDYEKAMTDWIRDGVEREARQKAETEKAQKEAEGIRAKWQDSVTKVKEEIPDFEAKIRGSEAVVSNAVQDAIVRDDEGPRILAYLADHPEEAKKWMEIGDVQAIKEVGRLSERLAKKEPPKAEPKAPTPITPIRASGTPVGVLHGHDDVPKGMDYDTWAARRRAGKIH